MIEKHRVTSTIPVQIEVPKDHPLLLLEQELPWEKIEQSLSTHWERSGRNVSAKRGRPFDVSFWVRALILMLYLKLNTRQMERELKENAVARLFVQPRDDHEQKEVVRDHSNIDRAYRSLGVCGIQELNKIILAKAVQEKFADPSILSADGTCQEVAIGYPNEPGILRKVAQRVQRLCQRMVKRGVKIATSLLEQVKSQLGSIFTRIKEYRLFAKKKEQKVSKIREMLVEVEHLMESVEILQQTCREEDVEKPILRIEEKFQSLVEFVKTLTPQIRQWLDTDIVAKGKLLHPGLQEACSIKRGKIGKKVEFGFLWLVNIVKGGYAFGKMFLGAQSEFIMPMESIKEYRRMFGEGATPELFVYDRGASSKKNVKALEEEGVERIGIVPKGGAGWSVGESDQALVKSYRARSEGMIGALKSEAYGFNNTKERTKETVELSGNRSFVSKNLNKLLSDLVARQKCAN